MMGWIWRCFAALVLLSALAACASLSKEECRGGDWRGIGFTDGANGRGPEHIERHRKACAKVDVVPDMAAWLEGRKAGLQSYCTPAKAYDVGRSGGSIAPYCSGAQLAQMRPAHDHGMAWWETQQDINALRSDLNEVERLIIALPADAGAARSRLTSERWRIERRLRSAELRQSRYASWPR
ncbi:hypothetical protein DKT77_15760 [Meridianimarinicoccus roseus]|uniref:DUF2799 domain-containing protein n=1 Tax=Meridianimarinicoccus roseus TaxID=2072018 RepID=A0A2V2L880_9RHOB|nr:DUF2799 domain-containing protein [Meridianimarinicoccus roseus]PWR01590.1 hypothetical protein DKT77_15760 [Meridianimarinicoccus roseus]